MKLYFEMYSGISGDMIIGSLLDLGANRQKLTDAISSLGLSNYRLDFNRVVKNTISAYKFDVIIDEESKEQHLVFDRSSKSRLKVKAEVPKFFIQLRSDEEEKLNEKPMFPNAEQYFGLINGFNLQDENSSDEDDDVEDFNLDNDEYHDHHHDENCGCGHNHDHKHSHNMFSPQHTLDFYLKNKHRFNFENSDEEGNYFHNDHDHKHYNTVGHHHNLEYIYSIIDRGDFAENIKENAKHIFEIIAQSESKAHGIAVDEVHFHEVGAIDSIIDIVGMCVLLDDLKVEEIYFSNLYEGIGVQKTMHGNVPVPVPAVANIIQEYGLKMNIINEQGEHITPTGIAFVAMYKKNSLPDDFTIKKIGIGAGTKDFEKSTNILRVMQIDTGSDDELEMVETNVDDSTGEMLGYVMDKLDTLALDTFFTPIYMKKNRPAYKLSVLCKSNDVEQVEQIIFRHTTTIGVRKYKVDRDVLDRRTEVFGINDIDVQVKIVENKNETYIYPEFESAKKLSESMDIPLKESYDVIKNTISNI